MSRGPARKEITLKVSGTVAGIVDVGGCGCGSRAAVRQARFFVGEATPATAAPAYRAFVEKVQQTPNSTNVFIDYREPIWSAGTYDPKWRNNATWAAGNLADLCSVDYLNRLDAGRPAQR